MSQKSENAVKRACKELGITQKELAERLGTSENTISQWARGSTAIPEWAKKFIDALLEIDNIKCADPNYQELRKAVIAAENLLRTALKSS
jgi:transcriptional regulator with XRE-family HTH domain